VKRWLLLLALLAFGAAAVWHYTRPQPIVVRVHTVARGAVHATVSNTRVGTVEACERAQMSPAAPGQVTLLNVGEGAQVKTGDILLEIWNQDRKAELHLAEAEAAAASARALEACAMAAGAKREAERVKKLRKGKLISEEVVDTATTEAESRAAACAAGRAATQVSVANIAVARESVERTLLRAPFDGIIAAVDVRLGEYLTPSPPGIATLPAIDLINPDCIYIAAPIDEVDAPAIRTGMPACVSLDAFPERRCDAVVRRIAPYVLALEKQARTVEVEVEFNNAADAQGLLPGYSVDIEVSIEARTDVLRIPTEAIMDDTTVFVFDADAGVLSIREIAPGISNWEYTEILSGLAAGEIVVVSTGREGVSDGAYVIPERADQQRRAGPGS
jgi:HlyD family secretion protein